MRASHRALDQQAGRSSGLGKTSRGEALLAADLQRLHCWALRSGAGERGAPEGGGVSQQAIHFVGGRQRHGGIQVGQIDDVEHEGACQAGQSGWTACNVHQSVCTRQTGAWVCV